jgi:hypothetical protein
VVTEVGEIEAVEGQAVEVAAVAVAEAVEGSLSRCTRRLNYLHPIPFSPGDQRC